MRTILEFTLNFFWNMHIYAPTLQMFKNSAMNSKMLIQNHLTPTLACETFYGITNKALFF